MKRIPTFLGFLGIVMMLLACRPVFAIGWTELIILVVIILILFGPFLLKVYRAIDKVRKIERDEDNK